MAFWHKIFKQKKEAAKGVKKEEKAALTEKIEEVREKSPAREIAGGILRAAHETEKSSAAAADGKYVFKIHPGANKVEVKRAVEKRYGTKVVSVNVVSLPAKKRRRGRITGWKPGFKKAIVTLKEGQSIEIQ